MGRLLMEALISSTTTSPGPAMPPPNLSPPPVLAAGVSSPPPPEVPQVPVIAANEENEEDDSYFYDSDPVHQVMEMFNFSVVARKPTNVFEIPLPPGEMMPKSQHIAEKKALYEMVQTHRRNLLKAQVEMSTEVLKGQELENKLQKVANVVGEVHNLYARFVQSLVALMKKSKITSKVGGETQHLLNIGPFLKEEEVDKLFEMLNALSSQFQNDLENLTNTKKALTEVSEYLDDKAKPSLLQTELTPTLTTTSTTVPPETAVVVEGTGLEVVGVDNNRSVSVGGLSTSSDAPTIEVPEDEFSLGSFGECFNTSTTSVASDTDIDIINELSTPAEFCSTAGTCSTVLSSSNEDTSSIFMPVIDPQQPKLADGRTLYTLVEYPERLNLVNKKHAIDVQKGRRGTAWFCICGESFSSASLVKYHVRYYSAKWRFMCTLCSRKYPGVNFLKLHMLRTHKIMYVGTNDCKYCSNSFQTTGELLRHLRNAHNKKLPPDVEHMTAIQTQDTSSIVNTEPAASTSSSSTYIPPNTTDPNSQSVLVVNGTRCACGVELGTKDALVSHIRSEVESLGQHFKCSICEETFNHPCNLKSHFREKHGVEYQDYQVRRYGCTCCDEMFESYEDLERHTFSEHPMDQDPIPMYDPLSDNLNLSMDGAETPENTLTFHVDPTNMDEMSFTLVEPPVVTLD